MSTLPDFTLALPEIILAAGAMVILLIGAFRSNDATGLINWLSIGLLAVALIALHVGTGDGG